MDIFLIDQRGFVVNRTYERGAWQPWLDLDGDWFSERAGIAAASIATRRVDVFAVDSDGHVRRRTRRDGTWTGWAALPGHPNLLLNEQSSLTAAPWDDDSIVIAVTDNNGQVWYAVVGESNSFTWIALPMHGFTMTKIAAARDVDGSVWLHGVIEGVADASIWSYDMREGPHGQWDARAGGPDDTVAPWQGISGTGVAPGQAIVTGTDPLKAIWRVMGQWGHRRFPWENEPPVAPLPRESSIAAVTRDGVSADILFVGADDLVHGQGRSMRRDYQLPNRQVGASRRVCIQAPNGKFVSAAHGGGAGVRANRTEVLDWERFVMTDVDIVHGDGADWNRLVTFTTHDGKHLLSCRNEMFGHLGFDGEATTLGDWEQFGSEEQAGSEVWAVRLRIRARNGNCLRLVDGDAIAAMGADHEDQAAQIFVVRPS
jgi:hypothetical protein